MVYVICQIIIYILIINTLGAGFRTEFLKVEESFSQPSNFSETCIDYKDYHYRRHKIMQINKQIIKRLILVNKCEQLLHL